MEENNNVIPEETKVEEVVEETVEEVTAPVEEEAAPAEEEAAPVEEAAPTEEEAAPVEEVPAPAPQPTQTTATAEGNGKMREHFTRMWAWFGWVGFIVAMTTGNREEELTKKYLNHALGMNIVATAYACIAIIPYLGWLVAVIAYPLIVYISVIEIIGFVKSFHDSDVNFWLFNKFNILK